MTWMIESVREANVATADVFRLYVDPSTWSEWGHNAKWARADGPLVEGGTVQVKAGYGKVYPCRIRRLVAGRALEFGVGGEDHHAGAGGDGGLAGVHAIRRNTGCALRKAITRCTNESSLRSSKSRSQSIQLIWLS